MPAIHRRFPPISLMCLQVKYLFVEQFSRKIGDLRLWNPNHGGMDGRNQRLYW